MLLKKRKSDKIKKKRVLFLYYLTYFRQNLCKKHRLRYSWWVDRVLNSLIILLNHSGSIFSKNGILFWRKQVVVIIWTITARIFLGLNYKDWKVIDYYIILFSFIYGNFFYQRKENSEVRVHRCWWFVFVDWLRLENRWKKIIEEHNKIM